MERNLPDRDNVIRICAWCDPDKEETNRLLELEEKLKRESHHYRMKIISHVICGECTEKEMEEFRKNFRTCLDDTLNSIE